MTPHTYAGAGAQLSGFGAIMGDAGGSFSTQTPHLAKQQQQEIKVKSEDWLFIRISFHFFYCWQK